MINKLLNPEVAMASGETLAIFDALSSRPTTASSPQIDTRAEHVVLDFDDSLDEQTYFFGVLPSNYGGGGLTVVLTAMATTATSGDVLWGLAFERQQPGTTDFDTGAFGAETTVAMTADSVSGIASQTSTALPVVSLSGATAGETFRLQVRRVATDASDTLVGDAELLNVELREA